jgi:hypothetical protein
VAGIVERDLGAVGVSFGLVADRLEAGDTLFHGVVVQIGHAGFDDVVEAIEALVGFGDALVQFRGPIARACGCSAMPATLN